MDLLGKVTVKALALKTRVALLGAPLGNKNAAGPHDGHGTPGNAYFHPRVDRMRGALEKAGVKLGHISTKRPLLVQRTMLSDLVKKQGWKLEDFT